MKTRAAIAFAPGAPLEVCEVDLEAPDTDDVLIKTEASGICHTDIAAWQRYPKDRMPLVLGHEGAGTVVETGDGVKDLVPGNKVILTGAGSCGCCQPCRAGHPNLCEKIEPYRFAGYLPGNRRKLSLNGTPVNHFFLQSAFAEYCVVPQQTAIKVNHEAPLKKMAHLACAGITGIGCVIQAAGVGSESSVAIFGCGSVGLCAVMGSKLSMSRQIIAVDILQNKLDIALELGAHRVINSRIEDPVAAIYEESAQGVDFCIVATDHEGVLAQAVEAAAPGGVIVFVATPSTVAKEINFSTILTKEKILKGSVFGSGNARLNIPRYVDLFLEKKLPIDRIISRYYRLDEINQAFSDLIHGKIVKGVILFE